MEVKQINQLMVAMGKTGIKRLVLKWQGGELELERQDKAPSIDPQQAFSDMENPLRSDFERHRHVNFGQVAQTPLHKKEALKESSVSEKEEEGVYVTCPMVGTFYPSAAPGEAPFVKVGDVVNENDVVCIIEAMKVMNEVRAGVRGTVQEVLIQEGHPVEYGTNLIKILPKE